MESWEPWAGATAIQGRPAEAEAWRAWAWGSVPIREDWRERAVVREVVRAASRDIVVVVLGWCSWGCWWSDGLVDDAVDGVLIPFCYSLSTSTDIVRHCCTAWPPNPRGPRGIRLIRSFGRGCDPLPGTIRSATSLSLSQEPRAYCEYRKAITYDSRCRRWKLRDA